MGNTTAKMLKAKDEQIAKLEREVERLQADQKYNGWTNYETWRVMSEVFDTYKGVLSPEDCKEYVNEIATVCITATKRNRPNELMVEGWLDAWLENVNWEEISDHLNMSR
jgi:hypothetical protein